MASSACPVREKASFTTNSAANRMSRGRSISSSRCRLGDLRLTIRQAATRRADVHLHQPLGGKADHLVQDIGVGGAAYGNKAPS